MFCDGTWRDITETEWVDTDQPLTYLNAQGEQQIVNLRTTPPNAIQDPEVQSVLRDMQQRDAHGRCTRPLSFEQAIPTKSLWQGNGSPCGLLFSSRHTLSDQNRMAQSPEIVSVREAQRPNVSELSFFDYNEAQHHKNRGRAAHAALTTSFPRLRTDWDAVALLHVEC